MEQNKLIQKLEGFWAEHLHESKGILSLALIITRGAREQMPPYAQAQFLSPKGDKLARVSHRTVQTILAEYGIAFTLPSIAGKISNTRRMWIEAYLEWLNNLNREGLLELAVIERWWIDRTQAYFDSLAFKLRLDTERSLTRIFRELFEAAWTRGKGRSKISLVSPLMEHLVRAKLESELPGVKIEHRKLSTAEVLDQRKRNFRVGDTVIHVAAAPTEAMIQECQDNLTEGLRPLVITSRQGIGGATALSRASNIDDQVEMLEIAQFLVSTIHERSGFKGANCILEIQDLVTAYNRIIDQTETDPRLKISLVSTAS